MKTEKFNYNLSFKNYIYHKSRNLTESTETIFKKGMDLIKGIKEILDNEDVNIDWKNLNKFELKLKNEIYNNNTPHTYFQYLLATAPLLYDIHRHKPHFSIMFVYYTIEGPQNLIDVVNINVRHMIPNALRNLIQSIQFVNENIGSIDKQYVADIINSSLDESLSNMHKTINPIPRGAIFIGIQSIFNDITHAGNYIRDVIVPGVKCFQKIPISDKEYNEDYIDLLSFFGVKKEIINKLKIKCGLNINLDALNQLDVISLI